MLPEFHFIRPLWLLALLPLMLLLWRLARSEPDGDVWRGLVDAHLLPQLLSDDGGRIRRLPLALLGLGWLLGVLALAGPTWERLPQPVYQAQQFRVLALDLSPSMNATDMPPTRLAHARFELLDLLHKAREGQTALLAYGAEPYLVAPLTNDTATIAAQVPSLSSDLLPVQGDRRTDLALAKAGELLHQAGAAEGEVILITDGLEHPASATEAAQKLRKQGYQVSVLGVGTAKGAPVPLAGGGFLKDTDGAIVLPGLQQERLRELAAVGAGRYVTAGLGDKDIEALVPSEPGRISQQAEQQETRSDQWREAGPWLLLVLLPLAALGFRRGWLGPLVLVMLAVPPPPAQAFAWQDLWLRADQQAAHDFSAGRHAEAAQRFERPDWRAAAAYESGDYDQALQTLEGLNATEAAYNRGNTLARLGRLEDAISAYDQALSVNPQNQDALHNKELVQKLLDQRKQQQQSGQQGQQEQQNPSDKQAQKDQQQQTGQNAGEQKAQSSPQAQQDSEQDPGVESQQSKQEQAHQEQQSKAEQKPEAQQAQMGQKDQEHSRQDEMTDQNGQLKSQESMSDSMAKSVPTAKPDHKSAPDPGLSDLLGPEPNQGAVASSELESTLNPEDHQAMEQMLRRVQDDPAGLLRQRFLLQHLRRSGQLP